MHKKLGINCFIFNTKSILCARPVNTDILRTSANNILRSYFRINVKVGAETYLCNWFLQGKQDFNKALGGKSTPIKKSDSNLKGKDLPNPFTLLNNCESSAKTWLCRQLVVVCIYGSWLHTPLTILVSYKYLYRKVLLLWTNTECTWQLQPSKFSWLFSETGKHLYISLKYERKTESFRFQILKRIINIFTTWASNFNFRLWFDRHAGMIVFLVWPYN